jgi:alkylated DNA repair dioxygenase AlkB
VGLGKEKSARDGLDGRVVGCSGGMASRISLADGGTLVLEEGWLEPRVAGELFAGLRDEIAWRHERIRIRGREYMQPRLVAWFGDPEASYTYSGLKLSPEPWPARLASLRARLERDTGAEFNSVLCNLYRNGEDSMGMHADDERELGPSPVIASVSLGAVRRFVMRHKKDASERLDLDLPHGSLLVMAGTTQHFWRHGVPKQRSVAASRVNLTFRRIFPRP